MSKPVIERWIDMDSEEYKLTEEPKSGTLLINRGMKCGAITADKNGHLVCGNEKMPLWTKINGMAVGISCKRLAAN